MNGLFNYNCICDKMLFIEIDNFGGMLSLIVDDESNILLLEICLVLDWYKDVVYFSSSDYWLNFIKIRSNNKFVIYYNDIMYFELVILIKNINLFFLFSIWILFFLYNFSVFVFWV